MKFKVFFIKTIILQNQKYDIDSFWKNSNKFGFYDTHGNIKQLFPIEKDIAKNVPNIMNYQNFDEKNILHYKDNTILFQDDFSKRNIKFFREWKDSTIYETISNDTYYRFGSADNIDAYTFSSQNILQIPSNAPNSQKITCQDDLSFSINYDNVFRIHNFTNNNFLFEMPFVVKSIVEKMEIKRYGAFIHCCLKFLDKNDIYFLVFQCLDETSEIVLKRFQKINVTENIIDFDLDKDNLIIASQFMLRKYKIHFIVGVSENELYKKYFKSSFFFSEICLFDSIIFFNGDKNLRYVKIQ